MNDLMFRGYRTFSRAISTALWNQLRLLDAQCRFGIQIREAVVGPTPVEDAPAEHKEEQGRQLKEQTEERLRRGLAPPREIYDVQNRSRIDWGKVPCWAWPTDPDLFEGCSHEG
jgi:hypothetical protein